VAVLGRCRDEAPGHADPLGSLQAGGRGRHPLPRALRWGVEHGVGEYGQDGEERNLLAEDTAPQGAELEGGYPEFTMAMLKKLGWAEDLSASA
jgi:hypothetical protein